MEDINYQGKVVIVTGSSSGIGAETAKLLAEYGAKLTLVGRNETRLTEVAKCCQTKSGLQPLSLLLDLTESGSCETLVNKTLETYGQIDVLINSAGMTKVSSLFDNSMTIFDELLAINLRVPYLLTQLALPHLIKTKGNVVNVVFSMLNRFRPGFLPFVLSKSALAKFTAHAAPEIAPEGVRINSISPGVTRTNVLDNLNMDDEDKTYTYQYLAQCLPNQMIIEPKEVASLICLVASDLFPSVNGSNFSVDGAASMT